MTNPQRKILIFHKVKRCHTDRPVQLFGVDCQSHSKAVRTSFFIG